MHYFIRLLFIISAISLACSQQVKSSNSNIAIASTEPSRTLKSTGANEPCDLVTKADASEMLGSQVKAFNAPPSTSKGKREQKCVYTTKTGYMEVWVYIPVSASEFEQGKRNAESNNKVQSLSGIGDQSWITGRGGYATIYLLKGNIGVMISLLDKARLPPGSSPEESLKMFSENLKGLAAKAASRITKTDI